MAANKELTVNLSDQSVDLSIYRPEKALHLEWKASLCRDEPLPKDWYVAEFIQNFPLLWKYREGICNTPELASINMPDVGVFVLNHHHSLGELLFLYNKGKLRFNKQCPHCKTEMLLWRSFGSPLSGRGSRDGFCPHCAYQEHDANGNQFHCYLHDVGDGTLQCPFVTTHWSIHDLVFALENNEANTSR